jgi:hypothetical protein
MSTKNSSFIIRLHKDLHSKAYIPLNSSGHSLSAYLSSFKNNSPEAKFVPVLVGQGEGSLPVEWNNLKHRFIEVI